MGLFSRTKKGGQTIVCTTLEKGAAQGVIDPWTYLTIPSETGLLLLRGCIKHIKSRGLTVPLLFLPFRPESCTSAVRTFIRSYFAGCMDGNIEQQFAITEPLVLVGILRWTYLRIAGGIFTYKQYQLFAQAERDMDFIQDAFSHVMNAVFDSEDKRMIFCEFIDLLATVAAHEQTNGHSAEKLARITSSLIFHEIREECTDFKFGYNKFKQISDANVHLLFAYVRELLCKSTSVISNVPLTLEKIIKNQTYPPNSVSRSTVTALKMRIAISSFSKSPMSLMWRVLQFSSRIDNKALLALAQDGAETALTSECSRVLRCIEEANSTHNGRTSINGPATDWLNFEDFGFKYSDDRTCMSMAAVSVSQRRGSRVRPRTQDWRHFSDTGFNFGDQSQQAAATLLPIDFRLPSLIAYEPQMCISDNIDAGVLSEVQTVRMDDSLWGAWIISMSQESIPAMKSIFGRCVVVETKMDSHWFIFEEIMSPMAKERLLHTKHRSRHYENFCNWLSKHRTKAVNRTFRDRSQAQPSTASGCRHKDNAAEKRVRALIRAQRIAAEARAEPGSKEVSPTHKSTNSIYALNIGSELNTALNWTHEYDRSPTAGDHIEARCPELAADSSDLRSGNLAAPACLLDKPPYPESCLILERQTPDVKLEEPSSDHLSLHDQSFCPRSVSESYKHARHSLDRSKNYEGYAKPEGDIAPELPELSTPSATVDKGELAAHRVLPWNTKLQPGCAQTSELSTSYNYTRPWVKINSDASKPDRTPSNITTCPVSPTRSSPPSSNASTEFLLGDRECSLAPAQAQMQTEPANQAVLGP